MIKTQPRVRRLMAATLAVGTAIALSAGAASAKSTAPKKLDQATGDKVVALVEGVLPGSGWTPGLKPLPDDGQVGTYPIDINGDGKPEAYSSFNEQHAKNRMVLHRSQVQNTAQGGTLNIWVDVLGFANAKNAKAAAKGANNTAPTGSFSTAAGKMSFAASTSVSASTSGETTTWSNIDTEYLPVNNFLVEIETAKPSDAPRTDNQSTMETLATSVVKYLKTGNS